MWKYVSRRLRESLEKSLELRRSWACEKFCSSNEENQNNNNNNNNSNDHEETITSIINNYNNNNNNNNNADEIQINSANLSGSALSFCMVPKRIICPILSKWNNEKSSSGHHQQDDGYRFKERIHNEDNVNFPHCVLEAVTWSGAIVCGWYTSQILCYRRKRYLHNTGWNSNCRYARLLLAQTNVVHSNILSHWVYTAPALPPSYELKRHLSENDLAEFLVKPYNVSDNRDDGDKVEVTTINATSNTNTLNNNYYQQEVQEKKSEINKKSFEETIQNSFNSFVNTIGNIEFELGVESINQKEYKTAVKHFQSAKIQQHPGATFNLGVCYEQGIGIKRDMEAALECYQIASSKGHPKAIYNLGIFYVRGLGGLTRNRAAAHECFKMAAELGVRDAKVALEMKSLHQKKQQQQQLKSSAKDVTIMNATSNKINDFRAIVAA